MSAHHHHDHDTTEAMSPEHLPRYRRILWIALAGNAAMFLLEVAAGISAGSLSLLADAIDFAGDALNYGVSLAVLSAALAWRSRAAYAKALSMMGFGLYILVQAIWSLWHGQVPEALTMGVVAVLALIVNVVVAVLLYAFREGDANMRSVWICSRNDAVGNVAVMLAALGVFGTGSAWPDLLVAALMATLALQGGWQVLGQARSELGGVAGGSDDDHVHHDHARDHHH